MRITTKNAKDKGILPIRPNILRPSGRFTNWFAIISSTLFLTACGGGGGGGGNAGGGVPADTQSPTAPADLRSTEVTDSSITMTWDASSDNIGVTSYTVLKEGLFLTTINSISDLPFTTDGLTLDTAYSYTVTATDAAGNVSAPSNTLNTRTAGDTDAPSRPINLRSTEVTSNSITMAWDASSDNIGVTGYSLWLNGILLQTINETSDRVFTHVGLTPSTQYVYQVAAFDAAGNTSDRSPDLDMFTNDPPNSSPTASNVHITKSGDPRQVDVSDELTAVYTYLDEDGDIEATDGVQVLSIFQWFRDGSPIAAATAPSYYLRPGDISRGHRFTVQVIPVAATGANDGLAVQSSEYSDSEALGNWARELTAIYGPILVSHPSEPFFPSSIEWYMEQNLLIASDNGLNCNFAGCTTFDVAQYRAGGQSRQSMLDEVVSQVEGKTESTILIQTQLDSSIPLPFIGDFVFTIVETCLPGPDCSSATPEQVWQEIVSDVSVDADGNYSAQLGLSKSLEGIFGGLSATYELFVMPSGYSDQFVGEVSANQLIAPEVDAFWLQTPENTKQGDIDNAKTYVHVIRPSDAPGITDIQYWFFYPFNGPGRARVQFGELHDESSSLAPLGEHYGDWEVVILRFADNGALLGGFMSSHGDYNWYPVSELARRGDHVLAYATYNGHAMHPAATSHGYDNRVVHEFVGRRNFCALSSSIGCLVPRTDFGIGTIDVDLLDTTGNGTEFNAYSNYELSAVEGFPLPGQEWIDLDVRWGQERNGSGTDLSQEQLSQIIFDQLGFIGILTGVGAVAACITPVVNVVLCPVYLAVVVPAVVTAIVVATTTGLGADLINVYVNENFNGPYSPGAKDDEYYYVSCPTEHKTTVVCPE